MVCGPSYPVFLRMVPAKAARLRHGRSLSEGTDDRNGHLEQLRDGFRFAREAL